MKFVDELIGKTVSSKESANVALNATQEAYAYLEAERKKGLGTLLRKAAENLENTGVDPQEAANLVAIRGQYLKDMTRGEKMFHQAASDLKDQADNSRNPLKPRPV